MTDAPIPNVTAGYGQRLLDFIRESYADVFKPEHYGAIGNGVADDTAAVRACFDAANATVRAGLTGTIFQPGGTVVLTGTYKLTTLATPIDILCNVMETRAAFIAPDSYAGIAVRVGHTTSGNYFQNASINLPDVIKSNSASIVAGSVGVKTMNIGNSQINFSRTAYFETGIHFSGLGQGTVYNQINIGWVSYCKVSLKMVPDTGGWVNQNTFVGGGIQQSPSAFGGGLRRSGWRHLVMDGASINPVNGNSFVGVSFEGDVSEYVFHVTKSYNNQFIGCRHEQGTAGVSVTVTASSATLTATAHGLAVGDMVVFIASVVPTSMFQSSPYYVVSAPTADTFTVSAKKGGTAVVFGSTGTSVTFYRPQKVYFDTTSGTELNNVIRHPALPTTPGLLEIINSTSAGSGNTVETAVGKVSDNFYLDDMPPFRARNRSSTPTVRPMFAAYPSGANPVEDPYGWTAALGDAGVLFAASGAETGRVTNSAGVLSYKRPADGVAYELASCRRSPSLISIVSLSLTASTTTTTTVTLTGASVNDHVVITPAANLNAGVAIAYARVSSADTLTIGFLNITGSSISLTVDIQAIAVRRFF